MENVTGQILLDFVFIKWIAEEVRVFILQWSVFNIDLFHRLMYVVLHI